MAYALLPNAERKLTPDEVENLDKRRRRGQLFIVIGVQCLIVTTLLSVWVGQDLTYSPGFRPMTFWASITGTLSLIFLINGIRLRRGMTEFMSY